MVEKRFNYNRFLISGKGRKIRKYFKDVERDFSLFADTYLNQNTESSREVGAYYIIGNNRAEKIYKVIGTLPRRVAFPGKGLDIRWSCSFKRLELIEIDWKGVEFFVRAHSHPIDNDVTEQDIVEGERDLSYIPENVRYMQMIYSQYPISGRKFNWVEHIRNKTSPQ